MGVEAASSKYSGTKVEGAAQGDSLDVPLGDYGVKLQLRGMSAGPLPS